MEFNMIHLYGWLLIGISFTAVIHMLGSSVLFIKAFQCDKGLLHYGVIVLILATMAFIMGINAKLQMGFLLATTILLLLGLFQVIVLGLPEYPFRYRSFLTSTNSSIVALIAFILAKQVSLIIS
jgi:hypothetical protein